HLVADRGGAEQEDAICAVAGNDVAGRDRGPADRVVGGAIDQHAAKIVAEVGGAGGVGAGGVAQALAARRAGALNRHARESIAGDDVASPGNSAAHGVVRGATVDLDPLAAVA